MRLPQAANACPALAAPQQKTHFTPQEDCGKRLGWQVLTSGSLTMINTLYWPRLSKAQPERANGFPARTNPKPSILTRLLERLGPAMSVALAGFRLVGEALTEARQMQREMRRRYPYFHE
jgi:hypothetical protein